MALRLGAIVFLCGAACAQERFAPDAPIDGGVTAARADAGPAPGAIADAAEMRARRGLPLTVMSYNMQHERDLEDLSVLAGYLQDLDSPPDFILCQEVMFRRGSCTADLLAGALGYSCRGTKRKSDAEGLAIVSRYPFAWYDELHLKARTSPLLLDFKRVSVMGEFRVPGVGLVRVVDVHFAYQDFEHHVRRKQLRETVEWLAAREREVPADVTILGGDFNMTPYRKEFAPMLDPALTGGLVFHNANSMEFTRGPKGSPTKRIDYIFVAAPNRDVGFLGETLLFSNGLVRRDGRRWYLSDHLPVLHEYTIGEPDLVTLTP